MVSIKINTIEKVKQFIKITCKFEENVYVSCGRYIVDGKSVLGIFSLDLSKILHVHIATDDERVRNKFLEAISDYLEKPGGET